MEKAKLENISLDAEDARLFTITDDLLLKAKAIKYSILPKLNVLLEETLSRIRKIYDVEVFNENSTIHSAPNFREKRVHELKTDYSFAFIGIGGSRLPIWMGLKREDNKPVKIIPYVIGYWFDKDGLTLLFNPNRYHLKYTRESHEQFFDFLLKNIEYIQTIQSISQMDPIINYSNDNNIVKPFTEIIKNYKKNNYYNLWFKKTIKFPLNYCDLNNLINSFVIFFPIYYSLLQIAQNKKNNFKNLISVLSKNDLTQEYYPPENFDINKNENIVINIDETKFIRAGIRWQVLERDDFKCVACGKSSSDGAILHVDHIIPRSKGGKDKIENYQTLCHLCNIGKSNKSTKNLRK
jgi:hypothetical protein